MPRIATWLVCASLLGSGRARAGNCTSDVRAVEVSPIWQRAIDGLREELASRGDVERCARVVVEGDGGAVRGVQVTVTVGGQRSAVRRVDEVVDLHAAVIALVLMPIAPPVPEPVSQAIDALVLAPEATADPPAVRTRVVAPFREPRWIDHVELGLDGGASWTNDTVGRSLSLSVHAPRGPWLAGIAGRFGTAPSPAQSPAGYASRSLEIGADVGARVDLGPLALDATAGPSVAILWQQLDAPLEPTYVDVLNPKTGHVENVPVADHRNGTVARLGGAVRAALRSTRRLALYVVARASFDVATDAANDLPMLFVRTPPLPTWSAGLAVGGELRLWP